tara:strand:+ start:120 stop:740 length:621 start_codon:yes stop_codon:yes gene_type:complete
LAIFERDQVGIWVEKGDFDFTFVHVARDELNEVLLFDEGWYFAEFGAFLDNLRFLLCGSIAFAVVDSGPVPGDEIINVPVLHLEFLLVDDIGFGAVRVHPQFSICIVDNDIATDGWVKDEVFGEILDEHRGETIFGDLKVRGGDSFTEETDLDTVEFEERVVPNVMSLWLADQAELVVGSFQQIQLDRDFACSGCMHVVRFVMFAE